MWLFFLLVAVPIIEIALFIEVGGWLGLIPTLAIVVATAVAGTILLRVQGLAALGDLQSRVGAGRDPTGALAHGALIIVAGIVLLTPGFFTDAVGLLLLVPAVRSAVIAYIARRVTVVQMRQGGRSAPDASHQTVETSYEELGPDRNDRDQQDHDTGNTRR